jgi:hypothetical protein
MQALMGPMILSFSNAGTLATIQTISATGMIASSLIIGIFSKTNDQRKILSVSLVLAGVFYALFDTSTSVAIITAIGFLADHLFNPLMTDGGALASTAGKIIGTGSGRGIGLMFFLSGLTVITTALIMYRLNRTPV